MYLPTRALEPLFPRPEVLTRPEDSPRPLRWDYLFRGAAEVMSWIMDMFVSRRGEPCVRPSFFCRTGRTRGSPLPYAVTNSPAPFSSWTPLLASTWSRFCNCVRAAMVAATIAGDDEGAEGERSPAIDDFGAAIDSHDGGFHAGFIAFTVASAAAPAALSAAATATAVSAAAAAATATLLLLLWCWLLRRLRLLLLIGR